MGRRPLTLNPKPETLNPKPLLEPRNAGNTCSHSESSVIGSLEFCTSKLETSLILVLGHSDCSAVHGATKMLLGCV